MLRRASCRYTSETALEWAGTAKLSLALGRATGCNSFKRPPSRPHQFEGNQGATNARDDRCRGKNQAKGGARPGLFHPAGGFEPRRSRVVSLRFLLAILRPP